MFTVFFRNSTTTPSQPGLGQLVQAALAEAGAEWTDMEAELRLTDGAALYLFGEDLSDGMLAEYPVLTDTVAEALYRIADRTSAFIIGDLFNPVALRTHSSVGEVRAADMNVLGPDTIGSPEQLYAALAELSPNAEQQEPATQRKALPVRKHQQPSSLFSRLFDLLFGKPV